MSFDYRDDYNNEKLKAPESLSEYEDEANSLIIKYRGEFPYKAVSLVSGVYVVRCLLQRRDNGADINEEQLKTACLEMFS